MRVIVPPAVGLPERLTVWVPPAGGTVSPASAVTLILSLVAPSRNVDCVPVSSTSVATTEVPLAAGRPAEMAAFSFTVTVPEPSDGPSRSEPPATTVLPANNELSALAATSPLVTSKVPVPPVILRLKLKPPLAAMRNVPAPPITRVEAASQFAALTKVTLVVPSPHCRVPPWMSKFSEAGLPPTVWLEPSPPVSVSVPAPFLTKETLRRCDDPLWTRIEPDRTVSPAWSSSMPRVCVPGEMPQSARIEPVPERLLSLRYWPLQPWVRIKAPQDEASPVSSANEPVWTVVPASDAAPPPPPKASQLPGNTPTPGIVAPRRASVPVKLIWVTPLLPSVDQFLVPVPPIVTVPEPAKVAPCAVEVLGAVPRIVKVPPVAGTALQVKSVAPVLNTVLASVEWSSTRLLLPAIDTAPAAALTSRPPHVRFAPSVLSRVDDASQVAVFAVVGSTPPTQAVVVLRASAVLLRVIGAAEAAEGSVASKASRKKRVFIGFGVGWSRRDRCGEKTGMHDSYTSERANMTTTAYWSC